jgi:RHS repeat-associated protein
MGLGGQGRSPGPDQSGEMHYWHRDYKASVGRWETPDPADTPWTNRLEYGRSDPLLREDPSGLDSSGRTALPGGVMAWDLKNSTRHYNQVQFTLSFVPTNACEKCDSIVTVQVVLESTVGGKRVYPDAPGMTAAQAAEFYAPYETDSGARVDFEPGGSPTYNAKMGFEGNTVTFAGHGVTNSPGRAPGAPDPGQVPVPATPATHGDRPSEPGHGSGAAVRKRYETCVLCWDPFAVYGCVKWGFSSPAGAAANTDVTLDGGGPADFSPSPSPEFGAAAGQFAAAVLAKLTGAIR